MIAALLALLLGLSPTPPTATVVVYEVRFMLRTGEGVAVRERDEMQRSWRFQ